MKKTILTLFIILFLINIIISQSYNPALAGGDINPAPLAPGQNGVLEFTFVMTTDENAPLPPSGPPLRITICMSNIAPATPGSEITNIGGTYASYFTWVYSSDLNCYQGTQNQTLPGANGGSIAITFQQTNQVLCPSAQMGYTANILPSGYMNGTNLTTDDALSTYTCVDQTLPIELLDFKATPVNNEKVALKWFTASEKDNAYFSIQRSRDGIKWQEIKQVKGAGDSQQTLPYDAWDDHPFVGENYYRLQQFDTNGNFSFSPIRSVTIKGSKDFSAVLYPNPGTDKFYIQLNGKVNKNCQMKIFNQIGKQMPSFISDDKQVQGKYIINTQVYPSGYYLVVIEDENGQVIEKLPLVKK